MADVANFRMWAAAANPFVRPETEARALRSARLGAVAALLMALQSLVGVVFIYQMSGQMAAAMRAAMAKADAGSNADPAVTEQIVAGFSTWFPPAFAVLSVIWAFGLLALAAVQWLKPGAWIPAILLALVGFGLLSTVSSTLRQPEVVAMVWSPLRIAQAAISYPLFLALLIASLRGALQLGRFRQAAVEP